MSSQCYVGIDVAKAQLDNLLRHAGPTERITAIALAGVTPAAAVKNNPNRLLRRLSRQRRHRMGILLNR